MLEIYAVIITIIALYLGLQYFTTNVSMMAYLWWMEEKNYTHPTAEQLNRCREAYLKELLRLK